MSARFRSDIEPVGIRVTALSRGLFGPRPIPRADWPHTDTLRATARTLETLMGQGRATADADGYRVPHREAAALTPDDAGRLGLPDFGQVSLDLTFDGRVEALEGRIRCDWRDGRQRPIHPARTGLILSFGGTQTRLSGALLDLVEAVDAYNAGQGTDLEARVQAWMPVQRALRAALGPDVAADSYTRGLTLYQAGAFALDVHETREGLAFEPRLMARESAASLADEAPDALPPDELPPDAELALERAAEGLLPPEDHRAFLRQALDGRGVTRDAYVVGRNRFVLIDPHLKPLLDVVRAKRAAPDAERRRFVRNPRAGLAEALGADAEQTRLFVETAAYSSRVLELGIWEKPKLPWLTRRGHTWLPEGGWRDADGQLVAAPDLSVAERHALAEAIRVARARGQAEVQVQGVAVPLSSAEAFLASLDVDDPRPAEPMPEPEPTGAPAEKPVLLIKSNYEDVEYEQPLTPRVALIPLVPVAARMGATRLKAHQHQGFAWLLDTWQAGWPGVLLADDMGLGKTFQALTFMAWLRSNQEAALTTRAERGPILVVAPTALLKNWEAECALHLSGPGLGHRLDAYGVSLRHLKLPAERRPDPGQTLDVERLRAADWILTTYETLTDHEQAFARLRYSLVLFDEMQKIKAPDTLNTKAAKALNADFVLGLTGTPIENRLEDLWCIMDRLTPGYLGDLKGFSATYSEEDPTRLRDLKRKLDTPVLRYLGDLKEFSATNGEEEPAWHRDPERKLDTRFRGIPPVMLRRMKADVLEGLPRKNEIRYPVMMPSAQAVAYRRVVTDAQRAAGARKPGDMLRVIHALRGVSLHPDDPETARLDGARAFQDYAARSARLSTCLEILATLRTKGEKALLFIESLAMQALVARGVADVFGLRALPDIINGGTPGEQRQRIVDAFQASPPGFGLLVLSPKAAGVGLTITAANHVIHLSRWWNPAVEDQCNDRAFRIGQTRAVTIHLPMAVFADQPEASFDRTLDALLQQKRALSREMLAAPVSANDTRDIFARTVGAS